MLNTNAFLYPKPDSLRKSGNLFYSNQDIHRKVSRDTEHGCAGLINDILDICLAGVSSLIIFSLIGVTENKIWANSIPFILSFWHLFTVSNHFGILLTLLQMSNCYCSISLVYILIAYSSA